MDDPETISDIQKPPVVSVVFVKRAGVAGTSQLLLMFDLMKI